MSLQGPPMFNQISIQCVLAAVGSLSLSRKRPATLVSQLVPAPTNDGVNSSAPASRLQVVVNGSVPDFSQTLRSRTMDQPVWSPPTITNLSPTASQMMAVSRNSSSVVRQAPRRVMSQSMRPSASTYLLASVGIPVLLESDIRLKFPLFSILGVRKPQPKVAA